MTEPEEFRFTENEVVPVDDGTTILISPPLLNALIHSPETTLRALSDSYAPVSLEDFQVDDRGRLVIRNAEFATAVRNSLPALAEEFAKRDIVRARTNYFLCINRNMCQRI